ncbi:unnamed protein product, partial [marine sediment metagenome]
LFVITKQIMVPIIEIGNKTLYNFYSRDLQQLLAKIRNLYFNIDLIDDEEYHRLQKTDWRELIEEFIALIIEITVEINHLRDLVNNEKENDLYEVNDIELHPAQELVNKIYIELHGLKNLLKNQVLRKYEKCQTQVLGDFFSIEENKEIKELIDYENRIDLIDFVGKSNRIKIKHKLKQEIANLKKDLKEFIIKAKKDNIPSKKVNSKTKSKEVVPRNPPKLVSKISKVNKKLYTKKKRKFVKTKVREKTLNFYHKYKR